jgi:O-antigen/teichoic acid export membrane protein
MFLNFMRAAHQSKRYNIITTLDRYGQLAAAAGFVIIFERSLAGFYWGWLVWDVLVISILCIVAVKENLLGLGQFSRTALQKSLAFGAPLLFFELGNMLLTYGDRYMVAHYMGAEATGLYAAPYNLTMSIQNLLLIPLTSIIFPWASTLWTQEGSESTSIFAGNILNYFLLISIPLVLGTAELAGPIINVLASAKYAPAAELLVPLVAAQVTFGLYHILALGLFLQKRTMALAIQIFAATIFNIGIDTYLIPRHGLMGAALGTLFGYILLLLLALKISVPLLPIPLNKAMLFNILLSALVMSAVVHWLPAQTNLGKLTGGIVTGAISYIAMVLLLERSVRVFAWNLITRSH